MYHITSQTENSSFQNDQYIEINTSFKQFQQIHSNLRGPRISLRVVVFCLIGFN